MSPFNFALVGGMFMTQNYRGMVHRGPLGNLLLIAQSLLAGADRFDARAYPRPVGRRCGNRVLGPVGCSHCGSRCCPPDRRSDRSVPSASWPAICRSDCRCTAGLATWTGWLTSSIGWEIEIERLIQEVKGVCDSIAHDLRTPLTRLLAGLERARRR